jgi:hypothetical protein
VVVQSVTQLTAIVPRGTVLGTVDLELESLFGSTIAPEAYTYTSSVFLLGDAQVGTPVQISAIGPPLQDWGVVKDLALGPAVKKGVVWEIGFSPDWELVHNSWKGVGVPLNGLGQGVATYSIPSDPGLIGSDLYFQAVFDNLPGPGNEFVLSDLLSTLILP